MEKLTKNLKRLRAVCILVLIACMIAGYYHYQYRSFMTLFDTVLGVAIIAIIAGIEKELEEIKFMNGDGN